MMIPCEVLMEHLDKAPFPASKEELVAFLQDQGAPATAVWMMERIPGRVFRFATDVENTVRLAHELRLDEPWSEFEGSPPPWRMDCPEAAGAGMEPEERERERPGEEALARAIRERLHHCRSVNARLIRVQVEGGVVTLEGRVTDISQGLLAAKIAQGVLGVRWVINNMDVAT